MSKSRLLAKTSEARLREKALSNAMNPTDATTLTGPNAVDSLIAALGSPDGLKRLDACNALVAMGRPAVSSLIQALSSPNPHVRWEAVKALGQIADPASAPALVQKMEDGARFEVRWLAAEGLIALRRDGLEPLFQALIERPDSVWLREGARHVLRVLAREGLGGLVQPVLDALMDVEPEVEVPPAALAALDKLRRERQAAGLR